MNLTEEQQAFAHHPNEVFVEACPGAGKTRTVLARTAYIKLTLPPRHGVAILSFTNKAIEEFKERAATEDLKQVLQHPNFIGTFDSFIRHFLFLPYGAPGNPNKPHVVDSWKSLEIEISLNGVRAAGISLDYFDSRTNELDISKLDPRQRTQALALRAEYERAARTRRENLHRQGHFSTSDARIVALDLTRDAVLGPALGRALAGRFHEIIVDEAQDCNPDDLRVLTWLRSHGVRITMVCDMDQSIYKFRHGIPTDINAFRDTYQVTNQKKLTGNFRCSPAICSLAASLRERATTDDSRGTSKDTPHPIAICAYTGPVSGNIGIWFATLANEEEIGISTQNLIVLAYAANTARLASGNFRAPRNGSSKIERLASAVGEFWSGNTYASKNNALSSIEKLILDISGRRNPDEPVSRTIERLGLDKRLLRRQALGIAMGMPKVCADTDDARNTWIACARELFAGLALALPPGKTINLFLKRPQVTSWSMHLEETEESMGLPYSTIHSAKGSEYPGVCVVIPPNSGRNTWTADLFHNWSTRTESEPKRVVYVGVTRAIHLSAIAIPAASLDQCEKILTAAQVPYEVHRL
jgi:superfamily I DNA/RNA helicase